MIFSFKNQNKIVEKAKTKFNFFLKKTRTLFRCIESIMSNMEMNVVASIEIKFVLRLRRKLDEIVRKMMKKPIAQQKMRN